MANKNKKKGGKGKYVVGGAIALALAYLFSGSFNLGVKSGDENKEPGNPNASVETQQDKAENKDEKLNTNEETSAAKDSDKVKKEINVLIEGDKLKVDGVEMAIEEFASLVGDGTRVVVKSEDSKVVFYQDLKEIIINKGGILIEE